MAIESFDHVAIPSADPGPLIDFYADSGSRRSARMRGAPGGRRSSPSPAVT